MPNDSANGTYDEGRDQGSPRRRSSALVLRRDGLDRPENTAPTAGRGTDDGDQHRRPSRRGGPWHHPRLTPPCLGSRWRLADTTGPPKGIQPTRISRLAKEDRGGGALAPPAPGRAPRGHAGRGPAGLHGEVRPRRKVRHRAAWQPPTPTLSPARGGGGSIWQGDRDNPLPPCGGRGRGGGGAKRPPRCQTMDMGPRRLPFWRPSASTTSRSPTASRTTARAVPRPLPVFGPALPGRREQRHPPAGPAKASPKAVARRPPIFCAQARLAGGSPGSGAGHHRDPGGCWAACRP